MINALTKQLLCLLCCFFCFFLTYFLLNRHDYVGTIIHLTEYRASQKVRKYSNGQKQAFIINIHKIFEFLAS